MCAQHMVFGRVASGLTVVQHAYLAAHPQANSIGGKPKKEGGIGLLHPQEQTVAGKKGEK